MPLSEKELNKMREEIVRLIDYNNDNWIKAAFFSDEVVEVIMENLYNKWSENGELGRPIDYAGEDEVKILLKRAKKYASMSTKEAMQASLSRMGLDKEKNT